MLENLLNGLVSATQLQAVLWTLLGVTAGVVVGSLPGLGPTGGIAVLLPLTFGMHPLSALLLLTGIYIGSHYGGRITAILINVPGEPAAVVQTFDGYPMTKQGKAGTALSLSALSGFAGGVVGFLGLAFLGAQLADVALLFGPPEFFNLVVFALLLTGGLAGRQPLKSFIAMLLGLLVSLIGQDPVGGQPRFTFGLFALWEGVDFAVAAIGLYGISEVLKLLDGSQAGINIRRRVRLSEMTLSARRVAYNAWSTVRGSIIGFITGVLPGAGATMASFVSYDVEQRMARSGRFGQGEERGLTAPEGSATGSVGGALVPMLALGIPGSASTAILLGGLIQAGLTPGPGLYEDAPNIVWGVIAGLLVANVLLVVMSLFLVPAFVLIINKAQPYLVSGVTTLCVLGIFFRSSEVLDIYMMLIFGVVGYVMRKVDFPLTPMIIALVLGSMLETKFRQALLLSRGDPLVFVSSPASIVLAVMAGAMIAYTLARRVRSDAWTRVRDS